MNHLSFISILRRYEAKYMRLKNKEEKFKMELLGNEIINLLGERREEAMQAYRKLLSSTSDEPIYLMRS